MHVIRLREPWTIGGTARPAPDPVDAKRSDRVESDAVTAGLVRYRRRFGRPTGLLPDAPIDLVIERPIAAGYVWLNDLLLGTFTGIEPDARFSLRGLLAPRNELIVGVSIAEQSAESPGPGLLDAPAFARDIRLEIPEE